MVPASGSAYSYSYAAFGELVAWIIGWDLIIEYAIGNVYVAQSWGDYFQTFLHGLTGWDLPAYRRRTSKRDGDGREGRTSRTSSVTSSRSICPRSRSRWRSRCFFFSASGRRARQRGHGRSQALPRRDFHRARRARHLEERRNALAPVRAQRIQRDLARRRARLLPATSASTPSRRPAKCRNPQRDLPRGLIWSLVICTVLYILTAATLASVVPIADMTTNDPLAKAMEYMGYSNFATCSASAPSSR